jgi:hypothetical protein
MSHVWQAGGGFCRIKYVWHQDVGHDVLCVFAFVYFQSCYFVVAITRLVLLLLLLLLCSTVDALHQFSEKNVDAVFFSISKCSPNEPDEPSSVSLFFQPDQRLYCVGGDSKDLPRNNTSPECVPAKINSNKGSILHTTSCDHLLSTTLVRHDSR